MAVKYLLDTSVLLALGWTNQPEHLRACSWLRGRSVATCSISELGFLRVSVNPNAPFKGTMPQAKKILADLFRSASENSFIADDLPGQETPDDMNATTVGDWHLAELADRHGMKFATLDTRIRHPAAVLI